MTLAAAQPHHTALTAKLEETKAAATPVQTSEAHSEELENKENQKFLLAKKCRSEEESCIAEEESLKLRQQEIATLKQQTQRLKTNTTVDLPKIRLVGRRQYGHVGSNALLPPPHSNNHRSFKRSSHTTTADMTLVSNRSHTVQLYSALSKIKWDYKKEDAVSGCECRQLLANTDPDR